MEFVRKAYGDKQRKRQASSKCISRADRVFKRCVFFHKFVGIWLEKDRSQRLLDRLKGYVSAAFTLGICIFQIVMLSVESSSVVTVLQNAMEAMVSIAATVKVAPIVLKRNNLLILIRKTKEIAAPLHASKIKERKIVDRWLNNQDKILKILLTSYTFTFSSYSLFPLLKENGLPFTGRLPAICYVNPWYPTIFAAQLVFIIFRFFCVLSNDILCITFLCQLCSELELVKHLIVELGNGKDRNVKQIIIRHAMVLDYGEIICETYSATLIMQHLNCSIFLCLSGLVTMKTSDMFALLKIGSLSLIGIITMLIICFVGEMVMSSSLEIASTIESSVYKDYRNDVANLKLLNFMLMRAQKPLCMMVCTQGKLSLRFFSENINKVASFFIYLKTLVE
ncbi:odorant receptor 293 isoform X1 [Nasonia vitripennis]|uniref:Odorant receptor n=1 Tax=Nasonia vitripennis TaxID=7425 RepID=A0A7M7QWX8_NASVI|nr:odorant receptor 293 isoform X1 [Nasonia vitripennis]